MNNNTNRILLALILSVFILGACDQKSEKDTRAVIEGDYLPFDEYIFLNRVTANNVKIVDSAMLADGQKFQFNVRSEEEAIFRLSHKELFPLMVIVKNGDTVRVKQTNDKAWPYKVSGSEECMLLVDYLERLNRDHYNIDSLAEIFHQSQGHPEFMRIREELNDQFIQIHEEHKEYAREFVTAHPSSLASIVVVNGFFKEFALFHQHDDFNYYEVIDEALMERMPTNKHVVDFHLQVDNIRAAKEYEFEAKMRLSPGRLVPEFEIPANDGKMVGPQNFKGGVLLIYFWSAADAKSRQINPVIKAAYDQFNKYGFNVLAISFDKDASIWKNAIKLDELPGVHASDLKGAGSPVQKLFNLKMQLPAYFLIDPKGRIFDHDKDFSKLQESMIEIYQQKPDY